MDSKTIYIILIFCVIAIIAGSVISLNSDIQTLHNTSNSVIGGGVIGIVVIFVLIKLKILDLD